MAFEEVRLNTNVSYGSSGGPGQRTHITHLDSGDEERIARWAAALRQYNLRENIRTQADMYAVLEHYLAMQGALIGWRYKDWLDYCTTATGTDYLPEDVAVEYDDVIIGVGDGSTTQFQLIKKYTSGARSVSRNIVKPMMAGSDKLVKSGLDAVEKSETTDWTVNTTSGIITYNSAPGVDVDVKAGCRFDVPVRFGEDVDADALRAVISNFNIRSIPNIPVVEIKDGLLVPEDFPFRGAKNYNVGIAVSVELLDGFLLRFDPTANHFVNLPDYTNLGLGGPYFHFEHFGSSFTATIRDHLAANIVTLATGQQALVSLGVDSGGTKEWVALQ